MIKNLLKPQCEKCEFLDTYTNISNAYADAEIIQREISINCKYRDICDDAEERGKKQATEELAEERKQKQIEFHKRHLKKLQEE